MLLPTFSVLQREQVLALSGLSRRGHVFQSEEITSNPTALYMAGLDSHANLPTKTRSQQGLQGGTARIRDELLPSTTSHPKPAKGKQQSAEVNKQPRSKTRDQWSLANPRRLASKRDTPIWGASRHRCWAAPVCLVSTWRSRTLPIKTFEHRAM